MDTCHTHQHQVDVDKLFQEHGIHCTEQRKQVWQFFSTHPHGLTISEAVEKLKTCGIGQATVYRTVELFVELGLLTRTQDHMGKTRYTAICPGHCHALICRECHAVVEFDDCDISVLEKLLVAKTGYQIEGHHLEIYGMCPVCASKAPATARLHS